MDRKVTHRADFSLILIKYQHICGVYKKNSVSSVSIQILVRIMMDNNKLMVCHVCNKKRRRESVIIRKGKSAFRQYDPKGHYIMSVCVLHTSTQKSIQFTRRTEMHIYTTSKLKGCKTQNPDVLIFTNRCNRYKVCWF